MSAQFDSILQEVVFHSHDLEDINSLADLLKGFNGSINASTGTLGVPISPPAATVSGWWLITQGGYILIGGVSTLFEAGDMLIYSLSTTTYSRVDSRVTDNTIDITSTFTKLLTGLATQKLVNEKLDKLITTSSSAPSVNDDTTAGYFVGCIWIKSSSDVYQAADVTTGAALWKKVSSVNDAQVDVTSTFTKLLTGLATQKLVNEKLDKLITTSSSAPTANDDNTAGHFVGCIWIKSSVDFYQAADVTTGAAVWKKVSSVNDAQVDVTSTFTKVLTGLATQKVVNEKLDKLITVTTTAPGVTSDTANGFFAGCFWVNTTTSTAYQCKDATTGAAVWLNLTATGSEGAAAYRDFTDQASDPASPSASVHRMFSDSVGQIYVKDSAGSKLMLSPGTKINHIGLAGQLGYGVGICPPDLLSAYNTANAAKEIRSMNGTFDINSDNYGNYYVSHDNSIIVWVPFFWAKIGTDNVVTTKPGGDYVDETAANAAGYFLPRGFINGGLIKRGVFMDKYAPSLTGVTAATLDASGSLANNGIMSSIKSANPISSAADTLRKLVTGTDNLYAGSFANCRANSKTPADAYYGGIDAVKSRGDSYHIMTAFERQIIWLLTKAHQAAAVGTTFCAWNGVAPYAPKGNNNYGADYNDSACTFAACTDAYWGAKTGSMEARKTGGANVFAKTTHNGQNSGICDINGNQWMFLMGITCIAESAQAITGITRAAEAVITVTNAAAARSNYANGKPVMITGTLTGEWATLLKDQLFTISDLSGNTFKIKNKAGAYVNTSALSADYVNNLSSTTGKYYVLKESVDVKNITSGNSGATDHWGATGVAAMFDEITIDLCGVFASRLGSGSNQVFSGETNRTLDAYKLSAGLMCMNKSSYDGSGTTAFGNDYFYIYILNEMALLGFGYWGSTYFAGVGASVLDHTRTSTHRAVSVRGCLYLL